jgi:uncharacterized protein YndB with AHSA1/START domain
MMEPVERQLKKSMKPNITVEVFVSIPREKAWEYWTRPEHIVRWNFATDDWCAPRATNDLCPGGKFSCRMEAKDGSAGFDFEGTYTAVETGARIEYAIADGRTVTVEFTEQDGGCKIVETFEAEGEHSLEMQRQGWQAILGNFKRYAEA